MSPSSLNLYLGWGIQNNPSFSIGYALSHGLFDCSMDLFNRQRLRDLAATDADLCISLFMPTVRFESEHEQNTIRYKNLLKKARQDLKEQGLREDRIVELLAPAQARLDDTSFWRAPSDGLAAFLTPEGADFYRLPLDFEELVVVNDSFHLTPLFPLIASNNRYYVLALSQNQVKLYQGTHYAISEIKAADIPENITEALAFDDPERSIQEHTGTRAGKRRDAVFHGHGTDQDDSASRPHADLKRFFDQIDNGVRDTLAEEAAPLVLAGVEYYLPIYREANKYSNLIEDQIAAGNPEHMEPKELHGKTWEIVEPLFLEAQQKSKENFHQELGHGDGLASDDLNEIVPASVFSRVHDLFIPIGEHRWGNYDETSNTVEIHDDQEAGDLDLLNFACVQTYLNGGTVHALRPENMPEEGQLIAATFRYPAENMAAAEQH